MSLQPQSNSGPLSPAPNQTPLLAGSLDQAGIPYQFRDKQDPAAMLPQVAWVTWFNSVVSAIQNRVIQDTFANIVNYPAQNYPGSFYFASDANSLYLSVTIPRVTTPIPRVPQVANVWQQLGLEFFQDTHANRIAHFPPTNYPPGTQFFETDRGIFYEVVVVGSAHVWRYLSGTMMSISASLSDTPGDLGVNDVGFQFYNDFFRRLWIWDITGSTFHYADGIGAGSQVATSGGAPGGGLWQACDGTTVTTAEDNAEIGSRTASNTAAAGGNNPMIEGGAGGAPQAAVLPTSVTVQSGAGVTAAAVVLPNEVNGGLPLRVSMAWYMRR